MDSRYNNVEFVQKYVGVWAFGYLNNNGVSESVYRTMTSLAIENVKEQNKELNILEIGCGVGRTSFDLAKIYTNSKIEAIDQSEMMIDYANKINSSFFKDQLISIKNSGFNDLTFPSYNFSNVGFKCTSFEEYDTDKKFDLIVNVNFLDRCEELPPVIKKFHDLLNKGGYVIGCTPLNFRNPNWQTHSNIELLKEEFKKGGLEIVSDFDNLIYRELLDTRGAYEEYKVYCFVAKKIEDEKN